ncbi:DUF2939 domain-containing protein [Cupriavidus sp. UYPR2.512]|uniref:DUF2939 domain-containing protein n=1 Tax=Cupriavidus sp. UYPR2.512 TaxID=1080187 RepID=UPI0003693707|nr:DUF2939 domain-containing protein [Cupriavidus sp. UYPR2.512]UIF88100.1 DUF2939 domain-containing protein [Cupriavidus necator]
MNKKVISAVVLVAAGAVSSYASPYWAVYQMCSAIEALDSERFSRYVDYPALRENLKAQIMLSLKDKMQSPGMKDSPFAGLGQMIGLAMVNTMIDTMVSPAGVMAVMAGEKPFLKPSQLSSKPTEAKEEGAKEAPKYDVSYRSWDLVQASASRDNGDKIVADLRRDGFWSWKWTGIKLPD